MADDQRDEALAGVSKPLRVTYLSLAADVCHQMLDESGPERRQS
jgi:hypothetical protein